VFSVSKVIRSCLDLHCDDKGLAYKITPLCQPIRRKTQHKSSLSLSLANLFPRFSSETFDWFTEVPVPLVTSLSDNSGVSVTIRKWNPCRQLTHSNLLPALSSNFLTSVPRVYMFFSLWKGKRNIFLPSRGMLHLWLRLHVSLRGERKSRRWPK